MPTSQDHQHLTPNTDDSSLSNANALNETSASKDRLTINGLIDAQVDFIQQWLRQQAEPLSMDAWHWFGAQPLSKYITCDHLQHLVNDWLLSQPMTEVIRADIRDVLHTIVYHPVNDNVPLSELVDDTQVNALANYIGSDDVVAD